MTDEGTRRPVARTTRPSGAWTPHRWSMRCGPVCSIEVRSPTRYRTIRDVLPICLWAPFGVE